MAGLGERRRVGGVGGDLVDHAFELEAGDTFRSAVSMVREPSEQRLGLRLGGCEQLRLGRGVRSVEPPSCPGRYTLCARDHVFDGRPDARVVPLALQPERDVRALSLDIRVPSLVAFAQRPFDAGERIAPLGSTDAGGCSDRIGETRTHPPGQWTGRVQQELEHAVRIHRRPHQCETELQHLDRPPEPGVIPESAPRQPHPLERVVEDDSVALGHEKRLRTLPGVPNQLRDGLRREVSGRRSHDHQ